MPTPYYQDTTTILYHGDMRDVLPELVADGLRADCIVTDPPYGDTALEWDRWPPGWPTLAATASSAMWCFGSMRMFLRRATEFASWTVSQDGVMRKSSGTNFLADRFVKVHEHFVFLYQGRWADVYHQPQRVETGVRWPGRRRQGRATASHLGRDTTSGTWEDDGTRLMQSVIDVPLLRGKRRLHPTEKPREVLDPLIRYACPPGGLVLDPFGGSGSTAVAARLAGRRTVLIEGREDYCEVIARRLSQDALPIGELEAAG